MKKWILLFGALVLLMGIASIGMGCKGKEEPKPAAQEQATPAEASKPAAEQQAAPPEAPKPAAGQQAAPGGAPPPPSLNFGESTAPKAP